MADATAALRRQGKLMRMPRPGGVAVGYSLSVTYLSLLVLIPILALLIKASATDFWQVLMAPQARSALTLTVGLALSAAAINFVMGVALAWVLARDTFRGRRIIDTIIDLPFALPTVVAGIVLLMLYGPGSPLGLNVAQTRIAVLLALLFVTLPFVVRAVQPVLLSLDRDVEDAAACLGASPLVTFWRVTFPAILPAALTGAGLAFGRALGEFGSIVVISGNLPYKTQVASAYIVSQVESGSESAAAVVSLALMVIAVVVLTALAAVTARIGRRHG